jgi:GMP synthase PP-ATPase subunit
MLIAAGIKMVKLFGGTHCFSHIVRDVRDNHCWCVSVISVSHQFLHGTTTIPMDKRDPNSRTRVTKMLCMTTNPEEKRKIIGDVFVKVSHPTYMRGSMKVMRPSFVSENVITITMKFTCMIRTSFTVMRLFFHKTVIFNTLLPLLSKMLYINVVKFFASTLEHISKTLFQFVVICKMASA